MDKPKQHLKYVQNKQWTYQNDINDVLLLSLLLTCSGISILDFEQGIAFWVVGKA